MKKITRQIKPVSPGEMLEEEFLKPLGLTKYRLAKDIGVPPAKDRRNRGGSAGDYRRHGAAAVQVFRAERWVVASRSSELRHHHSQIGFEPNLGQYSALPFAGGRVRRKHAEVGHQAPSKKPNRSDRVGLFCGGWVYLAGARTLACACAEFVSIDTLDLR
jgi:hypothetical protein